MPKCFAKKNQIATTHLATKLATRTMPPTVQQISSGALGVGVLAVGFYACVLYQRRLQMKRHQMYVDGVVKVLETLMKIRKLR